jgi:SAM-dependent methyltransferase
MGRFASTVSTYARARQPYGAVFFARVAERLGFAASAPVPLATDNRPRLLDLGTGPGLLAIGFAPYCASLVGVDPEPAMLAAAKEAAESAGVVLALIEATAETLPDLGHFDVVTIGRALHWMEPEPTRATLDRIVAPGGRVLVCRSGTVADARNPWLGAYDAIRRGATADPSEARYRVDLDAFFAGTRFRRDQTIAVETAGETAVDTLVARVFSMSATSPACLGAEMERVEAALRAALAPFAVEGMVAETVEARAEVFTSVAPL